MHKRTTGHLCPIFDRAGVDEVCRGTGVRDLTMKQQSCTVYIVVVMPSNNAQHNSAHQRLPADRLLRPMSLLSLHRVDRLQIPRRAKQPNLTALTQLTDLRVILHYQHELFANPRCVETALSHLTTSPALLSDIHNTDVQLRGVRERGEGSGGPVVVGSTKEVVSAQRCERRQS